MDTPCHGMIGLPLPRRLPDFDYPDGWEVRRVCSAGRIKWHDRRLFLTNALRGEEVGFEPIEDGWWLVRFTHWPLAIFDERRWRLRRVETDKMSPISSD